MRRTIAVVIPLLVTCVCARADVKEILSESIIGPKQAMMDVQDYCEARIPAMPEVNTKDEWEAVSKKIRGDALDKVFDARLVEATLLVERRDRADAHAVRALRVVGDPNARVRRIQLGVGYATPAVNSPDVDVVVSGELQETDGAFDSPEYVLDAVALGIPKGWIMLGHTVSEEQGMLEMAQWVKSFTPEVPVELVRTGEPFWTPK